MERIRITTIGGGSGQYMLLSGLRDVENIEISSIVSMVDSGGSTGRLRDEFGVLPPGDILKCLLALSPHRNWARKFFQTKFKKHERLQGHNAGNMLLTILSQYAGNFPAGIEALGEILETRGKVMPVTVKKATLVAELTDGSHLYGETAIDIPRGNQREKIRKVFLVPHHSDAIEAYGPAIEAVKNADFIIIGPGDLFTSIIPNFIVPGVKEAFREAAGKIIFILNIMTKFGETDGFLAEDFIDTLEEHAGRQIDYAIHNSSIPENGILENYIAQKAGLVVFGCEGSLKPRSLIRADLLDISGGIIRHHPKKLSGVLRAIINTGDYQET
jgi:uncharacterized cofD-like protein